MLKSAGGGGGGGGSGTVTSVSVVTANGLSGTVANPTTTPAITLNTDNTIAKTGTDINTSNQVTATHLAAALPIAQGGTAATTAAAAFNNLSPMTTSQDLIVGGSSGAGTRLGVGSNGNVLTVTAGSIGWAAPATNGTVTTVSGTNTSGVNVTVANPTTTPTITVALSNLYAQTGVDINTSYQVTATHLAAALPIAQGGTAATTASAAFNNLSPMTTTGDIIIGGASGVGTRLGIGSTNQVLTVVSGSPAWASAAGSGTVTTTGSPASGNLTKFSGATSITNGDLSGDVTTSGTLAATVVKVNGASVPASATVVGTNSSSQIIAVTSLSGTFLQDNTTPLSKMQHFPCVSIIKAMPPAANFAYPVMIAGGSTPAENVRVWDFTSGGTNYLDFLCQLKGYNGNGITFNLCWGASVNSGNVVWQASIRRLQSNTTNIPTSFNYATNAQSATATAAPSSVGNVLYTTIAFTDGTQMNSTADGEDFILRVYRAAGSGSDTMSGDAYLLGLNGYGS